MLIYLFCCFTSQVNSYGHGGTVSSPNHTFFLGKLEQAVNQYFVHILSLVTDNNPFKGGEWPQKLFHNQSPRKYGTGRGSTCNSWICSQSRICCQTHYRLRYTARCKKNVDSWKNVDSNWIDYRCIATPPAHPWGFGSDSASEKSLYSF